MLLIGLVLFLFPTLSFSTKIFHTVSTSFGAVRGRVLESRRGQAGYVFLGIPMAEPPVGELRFKEAVRPKPWSAVVDAFYYKSACMQMPNQPDHIRNNSLPISEDCLYINVFTSRTCLERKNCPVLVFVHGGLRWYLSPEKTPEEVIVNNFSNEERNIVYVAIPFRLGIFAWLNLSPHVKASTDSNVGTRDVVTALKWIQDEIHSFGGDPKKVTLAGHSSGAQLVSELMISPVSEILFNQTILWSVPFWGERNAAINSLFSQKVAKLIGCANEDDTFVDKQRILDIETCLRNKSAEELFQTQEAMRKEVEQLNGVWIDGPEGVLPDSFQNLLKRKLPQKNCLIGTVSAESKVTRNLINDDGTVNQTMVSKLCTHLAYEYNYEHKDQYASVCSKFYGTVENVPNLHDDHMYYYPIAKFADKFSETGNVFMYSFEYPVKGEKFIWNTSVVTPKHAEDLTFVLWGDYDSFTEKEFQMERIYSELVANFVINGNPSSEGARWSKWSRKDRNYFVIDFDAGLKMTGMKNDYYLEVNKYFEETIPKTGGDYHPLYLLPPKHDCFFQRPLLDGIISIWLNRSYIHEKNAPTAKNIGQIWLDHLDFLVGKEGKRNFEWSASAAVTLFCIIILIISLLCLKLRNPKGYAPLI